MRRSWQSAACVLVLTVLGIVSVTTQRGAPPAAPATDSRIPILAHFVNWFEKNLYANSWTGATTVPLRRDGRSGFGYDSRDTAVIRGQNDEMLAHGIVPLVSWWGPETIGGDTFLDLYLTIPGPRLGLLYEVSGRLHAGEDGRFDMDDPANAQQFLDDMQHLSDRFWSQPEFADRWFRIDGRPVLFIWLSHGFTGTFEPLGAQVRERFSVYLVGSDFNLDSHFREGLEGVVRGMDAVSAYGIYHPRLSAFTYGHLTTAYVDRYVRSYDVWVRWLQQMAPGVHFIPPLQFAFQDTRGNPRLTSTRDEAWRFAHLVRFLLQKSQACSEPVLPYVLLTSYNEHFEGSAVEPSLSYRDDWLDILSAAFGHPFLDQQPCPVTLEPGTSSRGF